MQFREALQEVIRSSQKNDFTDNWEAVKWRDEPRYARYPAFQYAQLRAAWKKIRRAAKECRSAFMPLFREFTWMFLPERRYAYLATQFNAVGFLYDLLEDQASKDLLVKIFAYRAIGHRKIKLPRNVPAYWESFKAIEKLPVISDHALIASMGFGLDLRDLQQIGFDVKVYCTLRSAAITFIQHHYGFSRGGISCKAAAGDVVIDAGACWGETSLYFAHEVGDKGKVFAFEFIPTNLTVLRRNIEENKHLAERIEIVDRPMWNISDQSLYYIDRGPGSTVSFDPRRGQATDKVLTISIDDLVKLHNLNSVDFIKMDIEGAETNALYGAEQTLRRFRPKLAISLYHSVDDFTTIPKFIDSLGLGYKYYLEHLTTFECETVLFAIPQPRV